MIGRAFAAAILLVAALLPCASLAADYPTRPIRLIVGSSAGGGSDFVARTVTAKVAAMLGQPIVVENKGGAAGLVASEQVAKSTPDGYTLLLVFANFATFPSLQKTLNFDPAKDLIPVSAVATTPLILVVQPSLPAKTVGELIQLAKTRTLNYASPGVGSMGHLAAELFQSMAGIKMAHIPYKGGAPAIMGLLGGQVQLYFSTPPAAVAQMSAGKVRALGVTASARTPFAPEVPTISESGLSGYEVSGWFGVFAPAGTPKAIVDALNHALADAARDPAVDKTLANEGVTVLGNSQPDFSQQVATDMEKWRKVIQSANIQLD